jgi:hypothetical protein
MSIFTLIFPAQASNTAMSALVDSLALSTLGFGLLGIVTTLLMVSKAKRVRSQNVPAKLVRT